MTVIGVLSDTHGRLHPRIKPLLAGAKHIIHAGDVGTPEVLAELRTVAPVTAVRGNCDAGQWAQDLPVRAEIEIDGVCIVVGHVGRQLRPDAAAASGDKCRFRVMISGHTHLPSVERHGEALYVNPGSAGPRRFGRAPTIVRLEIDGRADPREGTAVDPQVRATIITLE